MAEIVRLARGDSDAVQIGDLYAKACRSISDSAPLLLEVGELLLAKKASLAHGEWLPWLTNNTGELGFTLRTARRILTVGKLAKAGQFDDAIQIINHVWGRGSGEPKPYRGDNEWYTPTEYIERVRYVLGGIDLDPASNDHAQRIVKAARYFTKADDALTQNWYGRVWLNPPYSKGLLIQFVSKMVHELEVRNTTAAIMLLNNFTDADWFQLACSICAALCFPRGRIYFANASGKVDRPLNGQVFFYYGNDVDRFRTEFSAIGCGFVGTGSWRLAVRPLEQADAVLHPLATANVIGPR